MYVFAGEGPLQIELLRVLKPCQCDFLVVKDYKIRPLGFGFSVGCFGVKCDFFFFLNYIFVFLEGVKCPKQLE